MESYRPTVAVIDLRALDSNARLVKSLARGKRVLGVVKADAYGHGAVPVSKRLRVNGIEYLGVALMEEGIELREAGIRGPILVMGGIFPGQEKDIVRAKLTPFLFDIKIARGLNKEARRQGKQLSVHIKIDTGMGRIGLLPGQVKGFLTELKVLKALKVDGIGSHFSESYRPDKTFSRSQIRYFEKAIRTASALGFPFPLRHIANSAGLASIPESLYTLVRPGIILYGGFPSPEFRDTMLGRLKPVMSLKTRILFIKEVPARFPVSYGRTYITRKKSLIATLPIGYGDGYPRKLSNKGMVLVRGRRVPIVGRVCMDLTMVDVTGIPGVRQGDEAVLMGSQGKEEITSDDLADWAETVPYEIFTGIGKRIPRDYRK